MNLSMNGYIDLRFGGDASQVEVVRIDYSVVRTTVDLLLWACEEFKLSNKTRAKAEIADVKGVLYDLWDALAARAQSYVVLESYPRRKTFDVRSILDSPHGWRSVLGFHLSREYLVEVVFLQDPETKGTRPRTSA